MLIRYIKNPLLYSLLIFCVSFSIQAAPLTVTDMRGVTVTIPDNLERIATIDDGFVEGVLTHLNEIDKVKAIGSWSMKFSSCYQFESTTGETFEYSGLSTMKYLHPWLNDLPVLNSRHDSSVNIELLAQVNPQLVILRVGDCTVNARESGRPQQVIDAIEAMGFPLVVLYAPDNAQLATIKQEITTIGAIFNKTQKAAELADYLASFEQRIRAKTAAIPDKEKTRVLYIGLNPDARKKGAAGNVFGVDTPESYIIEEIVNAKNAFTNKGHGISMSAEQIYALDPDVIILPTQRGYHPARELYDAHYFTILNELRAIKERRVFAMPYSSKNCARRIEYPLDMLIIAKSAYPTVFDSLNLNEAVLDFYQTVYGVERKQAEGLRSAQLLDWINSAEAF